jgi:drug/metabolite transporter (DMT)-like permease
VHSSFEFIPLNNHKPQISHIMLKFPQKTIGLLLGLLGVICFGLTLTAARAAVPEFGAMLVGPGRAVLAAIPAALYLIVTRARHPARRHWAKLFLMCLCVIVGFPYFSALAMMSAPASHGAIMLGILPLATTFAAIMIAGERPSARFWLANFAGAAAIIGFALRQGGFILHPADLWLGLAVICAAFGYAWGGVLSRDLNGADVISWGLVYSAPILIPIVWATTGINWQASPAAWTGFLYVAIFSQYLGFFAWYPAMAMIGVARTGQLQLFQPFVTIASAAILIGEVIDITTIVFAVLIAIIVAFGQKARIVSQ